MNKTSLCYWFGFYDMIFEHHERPDDFTIQSIGKLDRWVKSQVRKAEKERRNSGKSFKSPASHNEVFHFE